MQHGQIHQATRKKLLDMRPCGRTQQQPKTQGPLLGKHRFIDYPRSKRKWRPGPPYHTGPSPIPQGREQQNRANVVSLRRKGTPRPLSYYSYPGQGAGRGCHYKRQVPDPGQAVLRHQAQQAGIKNSVEGGMAV